MSAKALVVDANILIRAVLGRRAREMILDHSGSVRFFTPDVAYEDARKYLPRILAKRGLNATTAMLVLEQLQRVVVPVELEFYRDMQQQALQRISERDADDWPVLACALALGCPVWTEDADFFGTGVPTWTTDRVGLYLS